MADGKLKIATCQFAVSADISANSKAIQQFIQQAKDSAADIVHFSECSLSGYAGTDFESTDSINWDRLISETEKIMALAAQQKIWVVLGSTHKLTAPNKPHNSLYLINPDGQIENRYDKRFGTERDLLHYAPGDRSVIFEINKIKCALQICFDLRFPEIYRQLKRLDVKCVLQSFYNARQQSKTVHRHIMQQTMQTRAASNYFWVSVSNSSAPIAPYASCFIQPDGEITNRLGLNESGIMINTVDTGLSFYDPTEKFRAMAMAGKLTNGLGQINDERSKNTKNL